MIFAFADCELDTARYELRRKGKEVHLEPQVFGVLAYLVEHSDRVVPKTELLDEVWGDRFVSESTLTSRIKAARRAVGDDGREQHVIRTVHGRGYRFVAPVGAPAGPSVADAASASVAGPQGGLLERDDALAALDAALADAARGAGRVVLVAGEPGIGKTALVRSFATEVTAAGRARLLWGGCDDLITPRPFAPVHDLALTSPELADVLASGASPAAVQKVLLGELQRWPPPTVLVIEDAHWADEATLDLVTFVARRIADVHGLLVLTYRDTELGEAHPLVPVIGSVPGDVERNLQLRPLSLAAVAELVGDERAEPVMAATRGNPFYVTELAATEASHVPPSVRHAVLARVARFPEPTRALLGVLAVAPARLEFDVLDAVRPDWGDTVVAAERGGMVLLDDAHVQFRHELARQAVLDALPAARRRQLHRDLLGVLVERGVDPARIVHHAEGAGDRATLATVSLRAARQAAAASAHREAHSQFRRALRFIDDFPSDEQARIREQASREAYVNAHEDEALEDALAALRGFEQRGDMLGTGRLHRWISRLHWFSGRRVDADAAARQAVTVLEPLGPSTELAWAYSNRSQLAMLAWDDEGATVWAVRPSPSRSASATTPCALTPW